VFDDALLDDPAALARVDDRLREVAGWGAEVRRATLAAEAGLSGLDTGDRPRAVVAAGPDGRLVRAVLEPTCPVPFVAWPHPGLPGWAGPLDLVVVVSRTGSEPDDVATTAEALRRGCDLVVTTPAGSPLAEAVGGRGTALLEAGSREPLALAVPVLCALHALGLGPPVDPQGVADALDAVAARCSPARPVDDNPAKLVALGLADAVPVVWGGTALAARAARRVAEALRASTGRPALSGDEVQLLPLLVSAPARDIFADPVDDADAAAPRPALLVLDDGGESSSLRTSRGRLLAAAEERRLPVHTVTAAEGPDIGRYGSLLATGRFAATYLGLGLRRDDG
jgi:hypothetical protein